MRLHSLKFLHPHLQIPDNYEKALSRGQKTSLLFFASLLIRGARSDVVGLCCQARSEAEKKRKPTGAEAAFSAQITESRASNVGHRTRTSISCKASRAMCASENRSAVASFKEELLAQAFHPKQYRTAIAAFHWHSASLARNLNTVSLKSEAILCD